MGRIRRGQGTDPESSRQIAEPERDHLAGRDGVGEGAQGLLPPSIRGGMVDLCLLGPFKTSKRRSPYGTSTNTAFQSVDGTPPPTLQKGHFVSLPQAYRRFDGSKAGRRRKRKMTDKRRYGVIDVRRINSETYHLCINGQMWSEVEWSASRQRWCVQDAAGRCLMVLIIARRRGWGSGFWKFRLRNPASPTRRRCHNSREP